MSRNLSRQIVKHKSRGILRDASVCGGMTVLGINIFNWQTDYGHYVDLLTLNVWDRITPWTCVLLRYWGGGGCGAGDKKGEIPCSDNVLLLSLVRQCQRKERPVEEAPPIHPIDHRGYWLFIPVVMAVVVVAAQFIQMRLGV